MGKNISELKFDRGNTRKLELKFYYSYFLVNIRVVGTDEDLKPLKEKVL